MKASLFLFMLCIIFAFNSCTNNYNYTTECDNPIVVDNFWEVTKGPYGVYIYDIKVNYNDMVFAATYNDGVWRSNDRGNTWQQVSNGLPINDKDYYIPCPDPKLGLNEDNELYVIYNYYKDYSNSQNYDHGAKLYKSTDNGNNWGIIYADSNFVFKLLGVSKNHIILDYSSKNYNTNITTISLNISTDKGISWKLKSKLDTGLIASFNNYRNINIIASIYRDDITSYKLLLSNDNGINWKSLKPSFLTNYYTATADDNGNLFVLGPNNSIERSNDNGNTWVSLKNGLYGNIISSCHLFFDKKGNSYLIYNSGYGSFIFRSKDNGDKWEYLIRNDFNIFSIDFDSAGYIYVFDGSMIYRSLKPVY
jgi:hypothetical protein